MKNLFNRVYIKHDNNLTPSNGQIRIIITDREMQYPISEDTKILDGVFIRHYVKNLEELNQFYGNRDGFWSSLLLDDKKILIISSPVVTAELLIQYWKSIFKNPEKSFLRLLYNLFCAQENLLGCREKERQIALTDSNVIGRKCKALSNSEFDYMYDRVESSQALSCVQQDDLPFEYLLMGYFSKSLHKGITTHFYRRIKEIVLINAVRAIVNAKEDFFSETHNYYLINNEDSLGDFGLDPIGYLAKDPRLSWVVDEEFIYGNEDNILKKYSLDKLKDIFQVYTTLFKFVYDEEKALDFIIESNYPGLLKYDIEDEKGNYFGCDSFTTKINGLLISHIYSLVRTGKNDELNSFSLR